MAVKYRRESLDLITALWIRFFDVWKYPFNFRSAQHPFFFVQSNPNEFKGFCILILDVKHLHLHVRRCEIVRFYKSYTRSVKGRIDAKKKQFYKKIKACFRRRLSHVYGSACAWSALFFLSDKDVTVRDVPWHDSMRGYKSDPHYKWPSLTICLGPAWSRFLNLNDKSICRLRLAVILFQ